MASTEEESIDKELLEKLRKYCAYQERCRSEIYKKMDRLEMGFENRDLYLDALAHERFWDEERYAKLYARSKFNQKYWGRIKIRLKLKEKRVSASLIGLGLAEIDEDDYLERLEYLIAAKRRTVRGKSDFDKQVKIYRYLKSKGYEDGLIKKSIFNRT